MRRKTEEEKRKDREKNAEKMGKYRAKNGRKKRSLRRIIEKFRKRQMTSIYAKLIDDFQSLKYNTKSVT